MISQKAGDDGVRQIDGIPVGNLWLLYLYASSLYRQIGGEAAAGAEDHPDRVPDLLAEVLCRAVEQRMRRNLTLGYRSREAILQRVRGRIDVLETEARRLHLRGSVACRFDEFTVDTPRNRYVRAALDALVPIVGSADLARRCRSLALTLQRMGVGGVRPDRAEMSTERFGRNDANDRLLVDLATLAFDLLIPTEATGRRRAPVLDRNSHLVRRLFERAVGGFYDVVLTPVGWKVGRSRILRWPIQHQTSGIKAILPRMEADIILDHAHTGRRVVVDTKFTAILKTGQYGQQRLKSGYLYQIYAYLRSQERQDDAASERATGLLRNRPAYPLLSGPDRLYLVLK